MILSKLKLYSLIATVLSLFVTSGYIFYQSYKLKQADNQIISLESRLAEANAAFDAQKQSFNRIKHELEVSQQTIEQLNRHIVDVSMKYDSVRKDINVLRETDHEVDHYLSTPIPDSLFDRLYKRSH